MLHQIGCPPAQTHKRERGQLQGQIWKEIGIFSLNGLSQILISRDS